MTEEKAVKNNSGLTKKQRVFFCLAAGVFALMVSADFVEIKRHVKFVEGSGESKEFRLYREDKFFDLYKLVLNDEEIYLSSSCLNGEVDLSDKYKLRAFKEGNYELSDYKNASDPNTIVDLHYTMTLDVDGKNASESLIKNCELNIVKYQDAWKRVT
jgi:hypothetical protein